MSETDLTGADLFGANLAWADLTRAKLTEAKLTQANLSGADLTGADLTGADLAWADLIGAKLIEANLYGANLAGANLFEANLYGADLTGAKLRGTYLTRANLYKASLALAHFGNTTMIDTDLDKAEGLDTCLHSGPSTIDSNTLAKSPNLTDRFLEGIGLPSLITGDRLTISFTSDRYGQLTPIEWALKATLGKRYIVEQSADRIVVKLDSPEQFQAALDAVVPVLAALETTSPGEIGRVTIEPTEGQAEMLASDEAITLLREVHQRLLRDDAEIPLGAATTLKAIEEIPLVGGVLSLWVERWLKRKAPLTQPGGVDPKLIYQRFKPVFEGLKGVTELPAHEEEPPKQLPPASDEGA